MSAILTAAFAGIILSIVTVLADMFVKQASLQAGFLGWKPLVIGCIIYALTGVGWFYVLRSIKLSTSGVI